MRNSTVGTTIQMENSTVCPTCKKQGWNPLGPRKFIPVPPPRPTLATPTCPQIIEAIPAVFVGIPSEMHKVPHPLSYLHHNYIAFEDGVNQQAHVSMQREDVAKYSTSA